MSSSAKHPKPFRTFNQISSTIASDVGPYPRRFGDRTLSRIQRFFTVLCFAKSSQRRRHHARLSSKEGFSISIDYRGEENVVGDDGIGGVSLLRSNTHVRLMAPEWCSLDGAVYWLKIVDPVTGRVVVDHNNYYYYNATELNVFDGDRKFASVNDVLLPVREGADALNQIFAFTVSCNGQAAFNLTDPVSQSRDFRLNLQQTPEN